MFKQYQNISSFSLISCNIYVLSVSNGKRNISLKCNVQEVVENH